MNSLLTVFTSGFKNWKTTLGGLIIALVTVWQSGGFDQLDGKELTAALGVAVMGFLMRDANKSSEASGASIKKKLYLVWWIPFLCCSGVSCAHRADGTKTFANLSLKEWSAVGIDAGKGAFSAAVPSYMERRAVVAADAQASGK